MSRQRAYEHGSSRRNNPTAEMAETSHATVGPPAVTERT